MPEEFFNQNLGTLLFVHKSNNIELLLAQLFTTIELLVDAVVVLYTQALSDKDVNVWLFVNVT